MENLLLLSMASLTLLCHDKNTLHPRQILAFQQFIGFFYFYILCYIYLQNMAITTKQQMCILFVLHIMANFNPHFWSLHLYSKNSIQIFNLHFLAIMVEMKNCHELLSFSTFALKDFFTMENFAYKDHGNFFGFNPQ